MRRLLCWFLFLAVASVGCQTDEPRVARSRSPVFEKQPIPQKTILEHTREITQRACAEGSLHACLHMDEHPGEGGVAWTRFVAACKTGNLAACVAIVVRTPLDRGDSRRSGDLLTTLEQALDGPPDCDPDASSTCQKIHVLLPERLIRLRSYTQTELDALCEQGDALACGLRHRYDRLCKLGYHGSCMRLPPQKTTPPESLAKAGCDRKEWSSCLPVASSYLSAAAKARVPEEVQSDMLDPLHPTDEMCGARANPWLPEDYSVAETLLVYCRQLAKTYIQQGTYWRWQGLERIDRQVDVFLCKGPDECDSRAASALNPVGARGYSPDIKPVEGLFFLRDACQQGHSESCNEFESLTLYYHAYAMLLFPSRAAEIAKRMELDARQCIMVGQREVCERLASQYGFYRNGSLVPRAPALMTEHRQEILFLACSDKSRTWICETLREDYNRLLGSKFNAQNAAYVHSLLGNEFELDATEIANIKSACLDQGYCQASMNFIHSGKMQISKKERAALFGHACRQGVATLPPNIKKLSPTELQLRCAGDVRYLPGFCRVRLACERYEQLCEEPSMQCKTKGGWR